MHGFETILPFLRPIEHLILDESVSEGHGQRFRPCPSSARWFRATGAGNLPGGTLSESGSEKYRAAIGRRYFGIEAHSRLATSRWQSRCGGDSSMQPDGRHLDDSKVQLPPLRNGGFDPRRDTQPGARQQARRLCPSTTQLVNFWWNRLGKNEPSYGAWEIHSRRERILLIEDTAEIQLAHENLVRFGSTARTERHACGINPRPPESRAAPPPGSYSARRDSLRRSVRSSSAFEHRPLWNHFDDSRQLRETGAFALCELRFAECVEIPYPRHKEQHCGFA